MIVDIQCIDYRPRTVSSLYDETCFNDVCPADCDPGPYVVLFGRCQDGSSIGVLVKDYLPYVRYELPEGSLDSDIVSFVKQNRGRSFSTKQLRKFYGYDPSPDPLVPKTYSFLDVRYSSFKNASFAQKRKSWPVVDASQTWTTKFCNELSLESWVSVKGLLSDPKSKWSTCTHEIEVSYKALAPVSSNAIAPLKILSFDCEMYSTDGLFPDPKKGDTTILICCSIFVYGTSSKKTIRLWKRDRPILEDFRDLLVTEDPDIITGWNIYGFDFQFLFKEYQSLQRPYSLGLFTTRFAATKSTFVEKVMASSAKGDNTYRYLSMEGRVPVDLMQIIKDDKKPEDNTLKHVASLFLKDFDKLDVSPQELFAAWRTQDPDALERVAKYCERDADIPIALIEAFTYVPTWVELSRVCYTPLVTILNSGQQRRIYNVISKFVHNRYAINVRDSGWPEVHDDDEDPLKRRPDYQGATVIEPMSGFYKSPVSVLDFESLYPSIIIYFNLCPSVLLLKDAIRAPIPKDTHTITHNIKTGDTYTTEDRDYTFAKHIPGVLPELLRHLLKSRKAVKAEMNKATGFDKFVLNGRQNALKIVCNSVYGFCGVSAQKGLLPCKPVAAVTTLKGRAFIDAAKTYVEATWPGSKVLYGDTDSIMVLWALKTVDGHETALSIEEAYARGEEASSGVTTVLQTGSIPGLGTSIMPDARFAVKLANEKVECPYLLIRKKMYAAVKHTPGKTGFQSELECKGIDAVRRDRTKVVRDLSEQVLDALMIKSDVSLAQTILSAGLTKMLKNEIPIEDYIMSKSLRGTYASENLPHVMAWKRMKQRGDAGLPPQGSRMPFVITMPSKSVPLYELAEHPEFLKKEKLRPWALYYIENIRSVMERLLEPTGIPVSSLFDDAESKAKFLQNKTRGLKEMSLDLNEIEPSSKKQKVEKKDVKDVKSFSLKSFV
jgi:DNA polymerase delta subunit 1